MSETDFKQKDIETEAHLARLENLDKSDQNVHEVEPDTSEEITVERKNNKLALVVTLSIVAAIVLLGVYWIMSGRSTQTEVNVKTDVPTDEHEASETGSEVKLNSEALIAAGIVTETVTQRPAVALLNTTGTIETNPQQTQSVTPLVGGRVETVSVVVGDYVQMGALLAVIASPEIAEMHGKLHESETRLALAERNLVRVSRAENRVAVLSAKAKLDEADATLKRTKRLIELGAGAEKDLISAETAYKTAKADYDFQSNISLNKEIQEAKAEAETARVDVKHIHDQMSALGVNLTAHDRDNNHRLDTSKVPVYAPAAGMVTERLVNQGAGIQSGTTLFVLSNLSSVFAIANVPESQLPRIHIGTRAEIRSSVLGEGVVNAQVTYIDPQLNEETRTGKVRLEVPNPNRTLRAGMFVEIGFQTGTGSTTGEELVVSSDAIQRIGEKYIVFVPKENEPGGFEVREVEAGADLNGYTRIKSGLQLGEKVVTKGSFILKTQLQKSELGDEH